MKQAGYFQNGKPDWAQGHMDAEGNSIVKGHPLHKMVKMAVKDVLDADREFVRREGPWKLTGRGITSPYWKELEPSAEGKEHWKNKVEPKLKKHQADVAARKNLSVHTTFSTLPLSLSRVYHPPGRIERPSAQS